MMLYVAQKKVLTALLVRNESYGWEMIEKMQSMQKPQELSLLWKEEKEAFVNILEVGCVDGLCMGCFYTSLELKLREF